jgi:hypothetical protein
MSENSKHTLHVIMQAKGGVGKSLISSFVMQYEQSKGNDVFGYDTDPSNATFSTIASLGAKHLNIITDGKIDASTFDKLINEIAETENKNIVIDTGSSTFAPLLEYLVEGEIFDMLKSKYDVIIHIPIMGGQEQNNTLDGLNTIFECFPKEKFVVWLNNFHGEIKGINGESFEKMEIFTKLKKSILAIVPIAKRSEVTFGKDISLMTSNSLTFEQIKSSPLFGLMAKQRLAIVQRDIFAGLDVI